MSNYYPNIDTNHLNAPYLGQPFVFSAAHLARYIELASFPQIAIGNKILFGIRGAKTTAPLGVWAKEITIVPCETNHTELNCLIGIWDSKNHKIAVYKGSTVPHETFIKKQQKKVNEGICNQLAQGLYRYFVGAHEPSTRSKEEGAYRLDRSTKVIAWRNLDGEVVPNASIPGDNIHSAQSDNEHFNSAGCQVVAGFQNEMSEGQYQDFRVLSGQSFIPADNEIMLPYHYLLIHSHFLEAITLGFNEPRYLQGSVHRKIRDLQFYLIKNYGLNETHINKGQLDGTTLEAYYHYQKDHQMFADAIVKDI